MWISVVCTHGGLGGGSCGVRPRVCQIYCPFASPNNLLSTQLAPTRLMDGPFPNGFQTPFLGTGFLLAFSSGSTIRRFSKVMVDRRPQSKGVMLPIFPCKVQPLEHSRPAVPRLFPTATPTSSSMVDHDLLLNVLPQSAFERPQRSLLGWARPTIHWPPQAPECPAEVSRSVFQSNQKLHLQICL